MTATARHSIPFAAIALAASVTPAFAHHPMGGMTPANFYQGLLSGLGHPVIGIDHLAAVIGVGIIAALIARGPLPVLGWMLAMVGGVAFHVMSLNVPQTELYVALGTLAIGLVILSRLSIGAGLAVALFAAAGFVHGYALGESIVGAEATPLAAYFAGLLIVQTAIALVAYATTRAVMTNRPSFVPAASVATGLAIALVGGYAAAGAAGLIG